MLTERTRWDGASTIYREKMVRDAECVCVCALMVLLLSFFSGTNLHYKLKKENAINSMRVFYTGCPIERERERERGGGDTHVDVADRTALILHRRWPLVSVGCMFACSHSIGLYYTQRDAYKKIKTPKSKKQHFHVQK